VTDKPCIVLDCNVLLQAAALEKSIAAKCLNLVESGLIRIRVSREVIAEAEDVLNRPEIRARFSDLGDEIVGAFLKRLRNLSVLVQPVTKKFNCSRDEDGEPYIDLAVAAGADFIISRDRDPLDLMTGHSDECKEFRQRADRSEGLIQPNYRG
jgi:putative PIN family toxin of toxin-antitoxin system